MLAIVSIDLASLFVRAALGVVMLAHGWNHVWGGGKLAGTGRWFKSIGFRRSELNALLASVTELGAGALLLLGALTPLAAAGVVGTMTVAFIANHRTNGFFIFRPGEGYEYVLTLILVAIGLGALGGGRASVDGLLGLDDDLDGWLGFALAAGAGGIGALLTLAAFWRPKRPAAD